MNSLIHIHMGNSVDEFDKEKARTMHDTVMLNLLSKNHQVEHLTTAGRMGEYTFLMHWNVARVMTDILTTHVVFLSYERISEDDYINTLIEAPGGSAKPHPETETFFLTQEVDKCTCQKCQLPSSTKAMIHASALYDKLNMRYYNLPWQVHINQTIGWIRYYAKLLPADQRVLVTEAAWLKDALRYPATIQYKDIDANFGKEVANIVLALVPLKGRDLDETEGSQYWQQLMDVPGAPYVKLCEFLAHISFFLFDNNMMQLKDSLQRLLRMRRMWESADESRFGFAKPMLIKMFDMLKEVNEMQHEQNG